MIKVRAGWVSVILTFTQLLRRYRDCAPDSFGDFSKRSIFAPIFKGYYPHAPAVYKLTRYLTNYPIPYVFPDFTYGVSMLSVWCHYGVSYLRHDNLARNIDEGRKTFAVTTPFGLTGL